MYLSHKKLSAVIAVCCISISGNLIAYAGHDPGGVRITGTIVPALSLSISGAAVSPEMPESSGTRAVVESVRPDGADILLTGTGQTGGSITLPLEIRTNVEYRLAITVLSSQGCAPEIRAAITSARASGISVVPGAAENSRAVGPVSLIGASTADLLSGPRVSLRGGFLSRNNALIANLSLEMADRSTMPCAWQASIRISLTSASR